jgi:AraC-type transcriptional regulator N-terminus
VHCIYGLGLAVTTQGGKQVMLGDRVLDYGQGQSMLTTIDLPIVSHVTRATTREPYLGLLLRLDAGLVAQAASEMKLPRADESHQQNWRILL